MSAKYFPLKERIYSQYNYIQRRQFFSVLIHIPFAYFYASIVAFNIDISPTIKILVLVLLLIVCFVINYLIFRVIKERNKNSISPFYDDSDIIIENYRKKSDEKRKESVGFELEEDVAINCLLMSEHYNYLKSIEYEVQKEYISVRQFVAVYVASSAFILFLTGII